jgi:anti-anti-sigma factor
MRGSTGRRQNQNRVDTHGGHPHGARVPISLSSETAGDVVLVRLSGRLDAHGAAEVEPSLPAARSGLEVVFDLGGVDYLSSAGVRVFVALHKRLSAAGGRMVLAAVQPYCREVFRISGLEQVFAIFETVEEARAEVTGAVECCTHAAGRFVFHPGSAEPGGIEVFGDIEDVLAARIAEDQVVAKKFSAKAYSLGLGALGPDAASVMPFIGEMMTIGGTMVWLPTDGNDTPDFLVPHQDSDAVVIRTGFNASIAGKFNEYVEFAAAAPGGATLAEVYVALFDLAKKRRPDYRGALALAMRAEVGEVFGCGVVKSPVAAHAPANGKWITDPSNYAEWFEVDDTPRHRNVTGLICGIGLDLEADLSVFDQKHLNATFYINPGNQGAAAQAREKLHNHGVFFEPFPVGEAPDSLEAEIQRVVEGGTFIDMRHLFDRTTIKHALIGVVYAQDFRPEAGEQGK